MSWFAAIGGWLAQILILARKEFLVLLRDPASRAVLIVPVFVQCVLFGYAASFELTRAPYAVCDASHSEPSSRLLSRIDASGVFVRAATLESPLQIAHEITSGSATVAISIPSGFAEDIAAGRTAQVQLILDGRNSVTAGLASAYMTAVVSEFSRSVRPEAGVIQVVPRAWFNENLDSRWTVLVGLIAALAMLQTMMTASFSVSREREQATFDQLLVTPLVPMQILIGKALAPIMVGLIQSTVIFLVIRFWFAIPMSGSCLLMYLVLAVFDLAVVGIGLSISAFALSMQQAMLYTFFTAVPMMLLSGIFTPVCNMVPVLQYLTYANPLRFAVDAVRRIYLEGSGLALVWPDFVPLVVIMAVFMPLAAWLFRNRLS